MFCLLLEFATNIDLSSRLEGDIFDIVMFLFIRNYASAEKLEYDLIRPHVP